MKMKCKECVILCNHECLYCKCVNCHKDICKDYYLYLKSQVIIGGQQKMKNTIKTKNNESILILSEVPITDNISISTVDFTNDHTIINLTIPETELLIELLKEAIEIKEQKQ